MSAILSRVGIASPSSGGSLPTPPSRVASTMSDIFATRAYQPKETRSIAFSPGISGVENGVADISAFFRALGPLIGADQTLAYDALGITTGENLIVGLIGLKGAWDQFVNAREVGSAVGQRAALLDMFAFFFQAVGGAGYMGLRPLTIASQILNSAPNSALGMATTQFANVGNGAFAGLWLVLIFLGAHGIYNQTPFLNEMKSLEGNSSALAAFLFPEPHRDLINTINGLEKDSKELALFKKKLEETARGSMVYKFLVQVMTEAQDRLQKEDPSYKPLSATAMDEKIKAFLGTDPQIAENLKKTGLENAISRLGLTPLESFGLSIQAKRCDGQRVAALNVKGAHVQLIEKAKNHALDLRINDENPIIKGAAETELKILASRIKEVVEKNRWLNRLTIVIAVLGAITTIAGFIACPPLLALVLAVLSVVFVMLMYGADWYFGAKEALVAKAAPGKHDKLFIYVSTAILIAGLIVGAGLTFGLSLAIPAFIVAMVGGGIALGHLFWSYKQVTKREREWTENHLNLQQCKAALTADKTEASAIVFFKKLSKEERGAIREIIKASYTPNGSDLFAGTDAQTRIKAAKKSAKVFWKTYRDRGLDSDLANARAMQVVLDQLKNPDSAIAFEIETLLKDQKIEGFDLAALQSEMDKNLEYLDTRCDKETVLLLIEMMIANGAAQEANKVKAIESLKGSLKVFDEPVEQKRFSLIGNGFLKTGPLTFRLPFNLLIRNGFLNAIALNSYMPLLSTPMSQEFATWVNEVD